MDLQFEESLNSISAYFHSFYISLPAIHVLELLSPAHTQSSANLALEKRAQKKKRDGLQVGLGKKKKKKKRVSRLDCISPCRM